MTRNRASAKAAGTRFERAIADYLAAEVDDRIDRRVKTGGRDKGDIGNVRCAAFAARAGYVDVTLTPGAGRVVVECKDVARLALARWVEEADVERGNDDALVGLVVHKRRGTADPGDQYVTMSLRDLVALLTGRRGT